MIIEGGGFPIRDKLLKLVEEPSKPKDKKNGKAKEAPQEAPRSDVLEISAENRRASQVKVKDFEEAVDILGRTLELLRGAADAADVHSGLDSSSLIKVVIS